MIDFNVSNYLRISFVDVILVLLSTALIILFAKHFFWDKILKFFAKRQKVIQDNIDASVNAKKEAEELKDEYALKMQNAGKEAHQIIETAKMQANEQKQAILTNANMQADQIKKEAMIDIEREKANAQKEMKEAISDVAIEAAKHLLKKEVDENIQREYVDSFIEEAGKSEW